MGGNDRAVVMQREDPESSKPDWPVQDNFEARFQVKDGEREDWGKKAHQSHLICDEVPEGSWEQKRTAQMVKRVRKDLGRPVERHFKLLWHTQISIK